MNLNWNYINFLSPHMPFFFKQFQKKFLSLSAVATDRTLTLQVIWSVAVLTSFLRGNFSLGALSGIVVSVFVCFFFFLKVTWAMKCKTELHTYHFESPRMWQFVQSARKWLSINSFLAKRHSRGCRINCSLCESFQLKVLASFESS